MHRSLFVLLAFVAGLTSGCAPGDFDDGPPPGWEGSDGQWWRPGTDTSLAFRPMGSLREMGVAGAEPVFVAGSGVMRESSEDQSVRAVRQSLLQFFRNEPHVVDSLFSANVEEKIRAAPFSDKGFEQSVSKWQKEALRSIRRVFHEPRPNKTLGKDIKIVYPDSLSEAGIGGTVGMQVYVSAGGDPQAIELLRSVHPVLDTIAMRAASEMTWQPAYLLRSNKSKPLPAWVRYNVSFTKTVAN